MKTTLLTLALMIVAADSKTEEPRKPHPLAPSISELSQEEETNLDKVIDRFMLADIGKLKNQEAKDARADFDKLGPDAIPALLRGLNRAARIEHSCPVAVIAKKLDKMLGASTDLKLLDFARDEIGADVGRTIHAGILRNLRIAATFRKNALVKAGVQPLEVGSPYRKLTAAELAKLAESEKGDKLKQVIGELEGRRGPDSLRALAKAAQSDDKATRDLGRQSLDRHVGRLPPAEVQKLLSDSTVEVRLAAVKAAAKNPALVGDLIDRLGDDHVDVRVTAHDALLGLSKGQDFGPESANASSSDVAASQKKWRDWWGKQPRR